MLKYKSSEAGPYSTLNKQYYAEVVINAMTNIMVGQW